MLRKLLFNNHQPTPAYTPSYTPSELPQRLSPLALKTFDKLYTLVFGHEKPAPIRLPIEHDYEYKRPRSVASEYKTYTYSRDFITPLSDDTKPTHGEYREVKNDEPTPVITNEEYLQLLDQNSYEILLCNAKTLHEKGCYFASDKSVPNSLLGQFILTGNNNFITLAIERTSTPVRCKSEFKYEEDKSESQVKTVECKLLTIGSLAKYIQFAITCGNYIAADILINNDPIILTNAAMSLDENRFNLLLAYFLQNEKKYRDTVLPVFLSVACECGYMRAVNTICTQSPTLLQNNSLMAQAIIHAITPKPTKPLKKATLEKSLDASDLNTEKDKLKVAEYLLDKVKIGPAVGSHCLDLANELNHMASDALSPSYISLLHKLMEKGAVHIPMPADHEDYESKRSTRRSYR